MTESTTSATTEGDDSQSASALFADVYARLKAMAGRQLANGRAGATLETTALVHELYLRMCTRGELTFEHQAQFFSYAARAMRHLLADRARDRLRVRAGGDWLRVTLTGSEDQFSLESAEQTLALDGALGSLEATDERAARVIELHYFAGLTVSQIAASLQMAQSTVDRDCRFARAFLKSELT